MGKKIANYRSYGQKLVSLFARLLFSGQSHSLGELASMLDCSKQTVLRLVEDIRLAYGVEIEESLVQRRKYYRINRKAGTSPALQLSDSDISLLLMCRAFTEHLLGRNLFQETSQAIEKANTSSPVGTLAAMGHYANYRPGTIDYTPQHDNIRALIQAMEERKICLVSYQNIMADKPKTFYVKPFKLFSHKDTVYLHAGMARYPGTTYVEPEYDPVLAIHRMQRVEMTDRSYRVPVSYDFEKAFNQNFGIIKDEAFDVTVRFTGWAARYVAERIWSQDQKCIHHKDGSITITFSATSETEVKSWVLFFGEEANVVRPESMVEEMKITTKKLFKKYT